MAGGAGLGRFARENIMGAWDVCGAFATPQLSTMGRPAFQPGVAGGARLYRRSRLGVFLDRDQRISAPAQWGSVGSPNTRAISGPRFGAVSAVCERGLAVVRRRCDLR